MSIGPARNDFSSQIRHALHTSLEEQKALLVEKLNQPGSLDHIPTRRAARVCYMRLVNEGEKIDLDKCNKRNLELLCESLRSVGLHDDAERVDQSYKTASSPDQFDAPDAGTKPLTQADAPQSAPPVPDVAVVAKKLKTLFVGNTTKENLFELFESADDIEALLKDFSNRNVDLALVLRRLRTPELQERLLEHLGSKLDAGQRATAMADLVQGWTIKREEKAVLLLVTTADLHTQVEVLNQLESQFEIDEARLLKELEREEDKSAFQEVAYARVIHKAGIPLTQNERDTLSPEQQLADLPQAILAVLDASISEDGTQLLTNFFDRLDDIKKQVLNFRDRLFLIQQAALDLEDNAPPSACALILQASQVAVAGIESIDSLLAQIEGLSQTGDLAFRLRRTPSRFEEDGRTDALQLALEMASTLVEWSKWIDGRHGEDNALVLEVRDRLTRQYLEHVRPLRLVAADLRSSAEWTRQVWSNPQLNDIHAKIASGDEPFGLLQIKQAMAVYDGWMDAEAPLSACQLVALLDLKELQLAVLGIHGREVFKPLALPVLNRGLHQLTGFVAPEDFERRESPPVWLRGEIARKAPWSRSGEGRPSSLWGWYGQNPKYILANLERMGSEPRSSAWTILERIDRLAEKGTVSQITVKELMRHAPNMIAHSENAEAPRENLSSPARSESL